jgi:hypothetical protein
VTEEGLRESLVADYQEMYELTRLECAEVCVRPGGCCHELFCTLTLRYARSRWGVELEPTAHPTLPLMGDTGCIAAPHLRPTCTVHVCEINDQGVRSEDTEWTERHAALQNRLEEAELQLDEIVGDT